MSWRQYHYTNFGSRDYAF